MFGKSLLLLFSFAALCMIGAMTISCGGSSSSTVNKACTGGPFNVVGDWTFSAGGSSGPGVITSAGLAVFFQTSTTVPAPGDTVVLPTITGACSFSGNGTAYGTPASGGGSASQTVTGNVNSATSISGNIGPTSTGETFTLTPNPSLTGQVTALTGTMLAEIEGDTGANIWTLALTPSGTGSSMTFTGPNIGSTCTITGSFSQEGGNVSTLNVFDFTVSFSGGGCPYTSTLTGAGFESSSDYFTLNGNATGTYLYGVSSSSATAFEIFPQTGASDASDRSIDKAARSVVRQGRGLLDIFAMGK